MTGQVTWEETRLRTAELYARGLFRHRSSSWKCWMSPAGSQEFRGTGHICWLTCWKLPLTEFFVKKEKLKPKLLKSVLVGVGMFTYDYMAAWELWRALPCSGEKRQLLLWVTRRPSQSVSLRGKQPTASFLQKNWDLFFKNIYQIWHQISSNEGVKRA